MTDYLSCVPLFYGGQFIDSAYCVWTEAMSYWWLLILVLLGLLIIAEMTKNGWLTGIATMIITGGLYELLPITAHRILFIVAVMGFALTLYAIFRGRDGS